MRIFRPLPNQLGAHVRLAEIAMAVGGELEGVGVIPPHEFFVGGPPFEGVGEGDHVVDDGGIVGDDAGFEAFDGKGEDVGDQEGSFGGFVGWGFGFGGFGFGGSFRRRGVRIGIRTGGGMTTAVVVVVVCCRPTQHESHDLHGIPPLSYPLLDAGLSVGHHLHEGRGRDGGVGEIFGGGLPWGGSAEGGQGLGVYGVVGVAVESGGGCGRGFHCG